MVMTHSAEQVANQANVIKTKVSTWPRFTRCHNIDNSLVIWLDLDINESNPDTTAATNKLQHIVNTVKIFNDTNACIDFLTNAENKIIFMVISNDISEWFVPLIEQLTSLHSIYILQNQETQVHLSIGDHKKVKGIFTNIDTICISLKLNIHQSINDYTSFSILPSVDSTQSVKFDELDQSFMYSQLLKEIIVDIQYDEKAKLDFVNFCRGQCLGNNIRLNILNQFESNYESNSPIWWYTKEPFVYTVLNQALRKLDIEMIIMMGFFIHDLHRQIEQIYAQRNPTNKMIIYRGQGISNDEFEKLRKNIGGLLSFNNFLSTSIDQDVSLAFGSSARDDPNLTGVLFRIEIDPSISIVPFAQLDDISFYSNFEREILFSMHTIFRISSVMEIENRLWQIDLKLTDNNDEQLKLVTECIRNEIGDGTGWVRMAGLLLKMGKFDQASTIYNTLLKAIPNNTQNELQTSIPAILNNTAVVHVSLGAYETAHSFYEGILEIFEEILPSDHPLLASIYNNIGAVYISLDNFTTALSYFQKSCEIAQKSLRENEQELSKIYHNIGHVYRKLGDYPTALLYYEKALEIDQRTLPPFHPYLATTYFSIAEAHELMTNYASALAFSEKTLEIEQRILPPFHPSLSSTYSIIGEKALEIQEKSLPSNHPDRVVALNNIGEVYRSMGDHTTALSYYMKALDIQEQASSSGSLRMSNTYKHIADVYSSMKDYENSLSYYEKALEIKRTLLPPFHLDMAAIYVDMGGLYQSMENYTDALSYYQKALEIQEKLLEPDHAHLAITYNDIGLVYQLMEDYSCALSYYQKTLEIQVKHYTTALSYYEKALEIKYKSLLPNHPSLAVIYNNMGQVYRMMEDYSNALSKFEKRLDIQLTFLQPDDSDTATTYETIGLVHQSMKNYSLALSYCKKAFEIQEKHVPSDDPELLELKETINTLESLEKD
ncbi:unnamed protein product [Rotaria sp. Silwood1]|nr:unnamed protein product [Rotaria sp. Silwood1]CAF1613117.1 unnamed protein product [Rotaria sp. Silwood1]